MTEQREQRDNDGSLFRNQKKTTEKHPDYTGKATIGGVEYWLSAWVKWPKSGGEKFMSLAFTPKDEQPTSAPKFAPPTQAQPPAGDDLPF